jgi:hypothetical protein
MAARFNLCIQVKGLPAMASAEDYRHLSAECLRIAHENQTANNRALLLRMAELWSSLAERADGDSFDLSLRQKTAGDSRGTEGS